MQSLVDADGVLSDPLVVGASEDTPGFVPPVPVEHPVAGPQ